MKNKVMIITGTSKGIGRSLAEYYLNKGLIVVGCSRTEPDLNDEHYEHFCLDVAHEKSVVKMVGEVYRKHKKIDYLINNAGIASMNHTLLTPASVVEKIFNINVMGTFLFSREAAKVMSKNKCGRIVNFSSIGVPFRLEGECMYASSKASVEMMTRIMSKEYSVMNITVNSVAPNTVITVMIKNVQEEKINTLISKQGIKKLSTFIDIANVIDFFIDEKSKMISGQIIYLGGIS